jgi:hypothetical protein
MISTFLFICFVILIYFYVLPNLQSLILYSHNAYSQYSIGSIWIWIL